MIKKTIKIPIYNDEITVLIGDLVQSAIWLDSNFSELNAQYKVSPEAAAQYFVINTDDSIEKFLLVKENLSIEGIYHDSLHLAFYVLDRVRVKVDVHNHEALAYLQGYIADKVIKILNK